MATPRTLLVSVGLTRSRRNYQVVFPKQALLQRLLH